MDTSRDLPLRVDELRDDQILKLIERAAVDPAIAELVLHLQRQACDQLDAAARRVAAELDRIDAAPAGARTGPLTVAALAGEARRRAAAGRDRRALADMLVIGAAANRHDPAWNMFDARADAPAPQGALLALLRYAP